MSTTFLITKKSGMTRIFRPDGSIAVVTVLSVLPGEVVQQKTTEKDGYVASVVKADKTTRECRADEVSIDLATLEPLTKIEIKSIGKGKGFAGTIKRHSFHRGPASHGSKNVRKPGSIGSGYPERVLKGLRMAGHMGVKHVTAKTVVEAVRPAEGVVLVRGAVPGSRGSIITVESL